MTVVALNVEAVAREHYGRVLAYLSTRFRDIALAEDALSAALIAALEVWPVRGIPASPDAWLLQTARRKILDQLRRTKVSHAYSRAMAPLLEISDNMPEGFMFPDERLKLIYACAHPAIAPDIHIALILQTVLGLEAQHIARAFVISPATMSQRLVRAKAKIRDARIPFDIPEASQLPDRLNSVLAALYAGFGIGWDDAGGDDDGPKSLTSECLCLARYVVELSGDDPEALGLLSLMLYAEARTGARYNLDSDYVPLGEQDVASWNRPLMQEAHTCLSKAFSKGRIGRFQLEAAIQNAHVEARLTEQDHAQGILHLYTGLMALYPALGVKVAYGVALSKARGGQAGLAHLDSLPHSRVKAYQPYWAARADILRSLGQSDVAHEAYMLAMGLTTDAAIRRYLQDRMR